MHRRILYLILFLFIGLGCGSAPVEDLAPVGRPLTLQKGRVVNAVRLNEGGNLLVVPFNAGVGIEANELMDATALMVVKGVIESLDGNRPYFNILSMDDADKAEVLLEGHITEMKSSGKLKRWTTFNEKKSLKIEGRLIDRSSGDTIVIFTLATSSDDKKESFRRLAYILGEDIGQFIKSGAQE